MLHTFWDDKSMTLGQWVDIEKCQPVDSARDEPLRMKSTENTDAEPVSSNLKAGKSPKTMLLSYWDDT